MTAMTSGVALCQTNEEAVENKTVASVVEGTGAKA
jgi:hypothetical protein